MPTRKNPIMIVKMGNHEQLFILTTMSRCLYTTDGRKVGREKWGTEANVFFFSLTDWMEARLTRQFPASSPISASKSFFDRRLKRGLLLRAARFRLCPDTRNIARRRNESKCVPHHEYDP